MIIFPLKKIAPPAVNFGIDCRGPLLVYKALNGLEPQYISDMLVSYEPVRTLRWSGTGLLKVPRVNSKTDKAAVCSQS